MILSQQSGISLPDVFSLLTARDRFLREDIKLKVAYKCFVDLDFFGKVVIKTSFSHFKWEAPNCAQKAGVSKMNCTCV